MEENSRKSLIFFTLILILISILSSCTKKQFKRNLSGETDTINITDNNTNNIDRRFVHFMCKEQKISCPIDSISEYIDISLARCICSEQSLIPNSHQLITILKNTDDIFYRSNLFMKCDSFIGYEIFEILLQKAESDDCYTTGHGMSFPYSDNYLRAIRKMIVSIDEMPYSEYSLKLGDATPKEVGNLWAEAIASSDLCQSISIRNKYLLDSLSKHYKEGKVVLR